MTLPLPASMRHPLDPDPAPATKARAVYVLGLLGFLLGPFVGGIIPATIALVLVRQAGREAYASGGFLLGARWIERGRRLAWAGIVLALTALVVALIAGLLHLAATSGGPDFDPSTD